MTPSDRQILVVEDNDPDYEAIVGVLGRVGLARGVTRALDGETCLDLLRGEAGEGDEAGAGGSYRPSLVVLDLNTPGLGGREVLAEIRADARLRPIPIVVFTSSDSPDDIAACYQTGANGYHVKRMDVRAFERAVEEIARYWLSSVVLPDADDDNARDGRGGRGGGRI